MLEWMIATIGEGIVALDTNLRFVFMNETAERLLGIPRSEVIGRTLHDVLPPEVLDQALPHVQAAMTTRQPVAYDTYLPAVERWFENRLYPSAEGLAILFVDVTARHHADEALRRREEMQTLLVSLLEQTRHLSDPGDVMWTCVRGLGAHLRVTRCMFGEVDASEQHVVVARDYVDGVGSVAGRHRLEDLGGTLADQLRGGRSFVVRDTCTDTRTADRPTLAALEAIDARAMIVVPLVKDGRLVAMLAVHQTQPRDWSSDELALLERLADQTWLAVGNARAEAALRESRDVLALAMRAGRMGAWSRNLATNAVWWSRELEELFGLPPGGFSGTEAGFFAFVHPEDRDRVEAAVVDAIGTGTDYVVEFRCHDAEGRSRWMDGRGRAVYGEDGTPLWLYGLGIDITERKHADTALAAAREAADADAERLHLAMSVARLGDWSWDCTSDLITCSRRAAEIFGLEPARSITWATLREMLHPDDRERAILAVQTALETRGDYAMEYRLVQQDRERWVSARGRPRYDAAGAPLGMQGVVQDVSHDRLLVHLDDAVRGLTAAEDVTSTAARMLGQHLAADRCAYARVDGEGGLAITGNYTHGIDSLVGHHRLSALGVQVVGLLQAGEAVVVDDIAVDQRLTPEERHTYEGASVRAFVAAPILKGGRLEAGMAVHCIRPRVWQAHEVGLVQQVASRCWESIQRSRVEEERAALLDRERLARREAEQQNRRLAQLSEAAESANRAKDEFLAMLGHELRNPLAPILTGLQLMRLRGDVGSDRERVIIERQVKHLTRLVDDLLDVSRIARGQVDLQLAPVETAEIVARAIEMASPLLEARTHMLRVDVPRTGLPMLVDAARLSQVVANLLTNAARYTPEGGTISVSARQIDGEIEVAVRDTGIGIAPDVLATVFDLFVQGRQASNRAEGGLGLGLAIVRNLVERHGGRVEARSEGVGLGSEFLVWVPQAPALAPDVPLPAPGSDPLPTHASRGARVLIVDDNRDAADMLAHVLSARGHDARVAHDGVDALRACEGFLPDTAFLDLGLPVMDGYELANRLRELPGLENIRLIAVTGYGQDSDRRRTRAAGFIHHLVKPVDISAIEALLA